MRPIICCSVKEGETEILRARVTVAVFLEEVQNRGKKVKGRSRTS
jgi:hypothetical protein